MKNMDALIRKLLAGAGILVASSWPLTAAATNAPASLEMTQSVFVIPSTPQQGRNPFYPNSTLGMPAPKPTQAAPAEVFAFVLNGITSPPRSTAIINGRTFEVGEEAEVRVSSGSRVLVKCEEITTDSATILVNKEKRVLKLRAGL